nr:unnamed protein product [Digitaria exilis]
MSSRRSPATVTDDGYSASTAFAETSTGWHVLKVENYSQLKGIGVARPIKSSTFTVGGHSWCITFFPDGSTDQTADWVCFGLGLVRRRRGGGSGEDNIKVRTKFTFLDKVGEPVTSSSMVTGICTFSTRGPSWSYAYPQVIKRTVMESCHVSDDDSFCVRCDVTVVEKICHGVSSEVPIVVPPSDLHRHLGDLLATGVGADVTFEVAGETFAAHRAVLAARSPVFMAELFGCPLKERASTRVRIDGVEPRVFEALLYFIYTDALPPTDRGGDDDGKIAMAQHLFVAPDRYDVERLASMCEFTLYLLMNASVAVSTLVIAEQHGCQRLKEVCFRKLKSFENYKQVLVGDELEYLARSCPDTMPQCQ